VKANAPWEAGVAEADPAAAAAVDGFGPDAAGAGDPELAVGAAPEVGALLVGAAAGSVVVVVVAAATVTTKKSATSFPVTSPGDVSPTNV